MESTEWLGTGEEVALSGGRYGQDSQDGTGLTSQS